MLMTKKRSSPVTPVRARSPHSMMIAASKSPRRASAISMSATPGNAISGARRRIGVDDRDVLAERAQRIGHRELGADRVAVGPA